MSNKSLFLLDAYALIYRAYFPHSKRPRLDSQGRDTSAIFGFANTLSDLLGTTSPDYVAVVFDPPGGSFRHREYEEYKAHRESAPEAIKFGVPYIKRLIEAYRIPIIEVPDYEADDVVGTLAVQGAARGLDVLMVTPDKDYAQLVTPQISMYRPVNGGGYEEWGEAEVCERFGLDSPRQMIDYLGMVGDSADNLPGIRGVGDKTAAKLLKEYGSMDAIFAHADSIKGAIGDKIRAGREDGERTRYLATICTEVPGVELDLERFARQEVNWWEVEQLFEELEFRTLLSRIRTRYAAEIRLGQERAAQVQANAEVLPQQDDLFAPPSSEASALAPSASPEAVQTATAGASVVGLELFAASYTETPAPRPMPIMQTGEEGMTLQAPAVELKTIVLGTDTLTLADLVAQIEGAKRLALAIQTDSEDALRSELAALAFAFDEGTAYVLPLEGTTAERMAMLKPLGAVLSSEIEVLAHNLKPVLQTLGRYGLALGSNAFDTMIAHYLLMPDMGHALEALAGRHLGIEEMPSVQTAEGLAQRVHSVYRLYDVFVPRLEEREQMSLLCDLEMPLVPVLAGMEQAGVRIDCAELERQAGELSTELERLETEIHTLAGRPFNVNSPRQVGDLLMDELGLDPKAKKTKSGGYSTSEEVLDKLRSKHPIVERILAYRGLRKLLSTYIEPLPRLLHEDGKLHTTFNQTVAATGRLSSTNPNIQNIPIRTPEGSRIRGAFTSDGAETIFVSADYSQIELRLMAHFSEDASLIEAFHSGLDIHQATAARIFGVPLEEVTPDMRRRAKTANFGIIYGVSAFGLSEQLGVSRTEARALIDGYFAAYPAVDAYMKRVVREAQHDGYVSTLLGRRRYLPDINNPNGSVRSHAERNAINAPLQGTAADIIKLAMIRLDEAMRKRGLRSQMILQVHDELNFNAYRDELDTLIPLIRETMESALSGLRVPLVVEVGTGTNWLEAH